MEHVFPANDAYRHLLPEAQDARDDAESRLRQVLENTSAVVFLKDFDGTYLYVNRRFCTLFGMTESELRGRRDVDIFPPEVAQRLRADDLRVREARAALEFDEDLIVNGERCAYLAIKFPLIDAQGAPYAICGIATDITGRKRSEEALRSAALAVSTAQGDVVYRELTRYLATTLGVECAFIAMCKTPRSDAVRTLSIFSDGSFEDNVEYALAGTACGTVVGKAFHLVPSGVRKIFPADRMFRRLEIEGYAAYPLNDSSGAPLGLIAICSRRPLTNPDLVESMLKIFAARAAAELQRNRTEAAQRLSEASYRAIFEAAEDAIFVHDWDSGRILDVSPKAAEIYGYSREELLHMRVGEVSSGESPYTEHDAGRLIHEAKTCSTPLRFEWHARHKDGRLMWHEVTLKRATITGEPRILAFVRDVTDRKLAEEALRRAALTVSAAAGDTLFEDLVRGLAATLDVDIAYIAQFAHGSTSRMRRLAWIVDGTLREPEEFDLEGTPCETVVARDFRFYPERLRERFSRGGLRQFGPESYAAFPLSDTQGRPLGLIAVVHRKPMTDPARFESVLKIFAARAASEIERRRSDADLRTREEQYRAIFNASADALVLRDTDFRVVDVNPAYVAMSGFAREEVLGVDRVTAAPLEVARVVKALHHQTLAGTPVYLETTGLRKSGESFDMELRGVPIQHQGRPHVLYISRDITARKRAEAERAELEAQLRQAQKMEALGQLTGGIAHDFNNILTSIMGYIVLATERQEEVGDAKLAKYLEQAHLASTRARDLIQQMLTFSRGQKGERRPLKLPLFVKEAAKLLRMTLPSSIELETDLQRDVPAVLMDPVQVEQVLLNLCINARDAMQGAGSIRVEVRLARHLNGVCTSCRQSVRGAMLELRVRDTGPGIAPEVMDRMFEPFFSTKEVGKGSGMGLSTVHGIVHEHGGHIIVDTPPGGGAVFRVVLPPLDQGVGLERPTRARAPGRRPRAPLSGRILVVEDEEMVGEFMSDLLAGWGLEVTVKGNPLDARELFLGSPERVDLVISDQTMPRMTGIDLARELLAKRPDLPVILYTGYSDTLTEEQVSATGIRALIKKPVDPSVLLSALRTHLPRKRKTPEA